MKRLLSSKNVKEADDKDALLDDEIELEVLDSLIDKKDDNDEARLKQESRSKPFGWGWPLVVYIATFLITLILLLVTEAAVDNHEPCFRIEHAGHIGHCARIALFELPVFVFFSIFATWWIFRTKPWSRKANIRHTRTHPKWVGLSATLKGLCVIIAPVLLESFGMTQEREYVAPTLWIANQTMRVTSWLLNMVVTGFCIKNGSRTTGFVCVFWVTSTWAVYVELIATFNENPTAGEPPAFWQKMIFVFGALFMTFLAGIGLFEQSMKRPYSKKDGGPATPAEDGRKQLPKPKHVWAIFSPEAPLILCGLVFAVCEGVFTLYSLSNIALLMSGAGVDPESDAPSYGKTTFFFLLYTALMAGALATQQSIFLLLGERAVRRIRYRLFSNILEQDRNWLDKNENSTGILISNLTVDADAFAQVLTTELANVVTPTVGVASSFIFLFQLSWRVSLIVLSCALLNMLFTSIRSKYITASYSMDYAIARGEVINKGTETLKGLEVVRNFGEESSERDRFKTLLALQYVVGAKKGVIESLFMGLEGFLNLAVVGFALWFGSLLVTKGQLERENLAAFAMVGMNATSRMSMLTMVLPGIAAAAGPAARVLDLINRRPDTHGYIDMDKGEKLDTLKGEIEFKAVDFCYTERITAGAPDAKPRKPNCQFSLHVPAGSSLALVGKSGAGKSTAMQLMMRAYDLKSSDKGIILMDGKNINSLSPRWLNENVGIVSQQPFLFANSLYFNITYGHSHKDAAYEWGNPPRKRVVSEEAFWSAVRRANAADFCRPDNIDDDDAVGEGGDKLSGGQRQRVSIARVMLKDPPVLFLDEATSALDPESEFMVVEALRNLTEGRTCVMIAHRLNTIAHADNIVVLAEGRIKEEGTHDNLIASSGMYKEMHMKQQETQWGNTDGAGEDDGDEGDNDNNNISTATGGDATGNDGEEKVWVTREVIQSRRRAQSAADRREAEVSPAVEKTVRGSVI